MTDTFGNYGSDHPPKVVLIGPEESQEFATNPKMNHSRSIFAAHLDEGRITRVIDPVLFN